MLSAKVLLSPGTVVCTAGESARLVWTILNDGKQEWPSECSMLEVDGRGETCGPRLATLPAVQVGCSVDVGLHATTHAAGQYQQSFALRLVTPEGVALGDDLSARIVVAETCAQEHLCAGDSSRKLLRDFVIAPLGPKQGHGPLVPFQEWAVVRPVQKLPAALQSYFGHPELSQLQFHVNGELHTVRAGEHPVTMSFAEYLRYYNRKTGTKVQCGEGGCGACTVSLRVLMKGNEAGGPFIANACLRPLLLMGGMEVNTVESIGTPSKPHAIQSAIIKHGGSQCGACTPGMVMAIYGHMTKGGDVHEGLDDCIQGNLCRCTGYRPIYDAIHDLAAGPPIVAEKTAGKLNTDQPQRSLFIDGDRTWVNCTELKDVFVALAGCADRPHRLVVGNTSTGVIKYYPPHPSDDPQVFINVSTVPDLLEIKQVKDHGLIVGAAVPLTRLITSLETLIQEYPQFSSIVKHLKLVAHPQVRNVGSWAGNVMIAKTHPDFPSDVCLLLTLLGASLTLVDSSGTQQAILVENFLKDTSVPKTGSAAQIIKSVMIPFPSSTSVVETFKVMRRKMNTHAEVNAGFLFDFTSDVGIQVKQARIVIGNITLGPLIATKAATALSGRALDDSAVQQALDVFAGELVVASPSVPDPPFVAPGATYRQKLAKNLFYKAVQRARLARKVELTPEEASAASVFVRGPSSGTHKFPAPDPANFPVGQEKTKYKGLEQASGVTVYTADQPLKPGTLFAAAVTAAKIGLIEEVDPSEALQLEQVQYFISADDIAKVGGINSLEGVGGAYLPKVFADKEHSTAYVGEMIGLVLAESLVQAEIAAKLVKVHYKETGASAATSRTSHGSRASEHSRLVASLRREQACQAGKKILSISDSVTSSGQRHFYLETQTSYASLDDDGQLVVSLATQYGKLVETCMLKALPKVKFTLQVPQVGGAYGGKNFLSVPACLAVSIATLATNRPVLLPTDRNADFQTYGGRPEFTGKWSCDFDSETLKIEHLTQEATRMESIGKGKSSFPLTMLNCYVVSRDKISFHSQAIEENIAPITIMRAPSFFEAAFFMENIIEHMAREAGKEPFEVQEANMDLSDKDMGPVWQKAKDMMSFDATRTAVADFNQKHKYQKQGLYIMGSKYTGIMDQVVTELCFLKVTGEGLVLVDHSGIEMGQGMDTKVVQACVMKFRTLAKDVSDQNIETELPRSEKNFKWRSVSPTWSSTTSECLVFAVMQACDKLIETMKPFATPGRNWAEITSVATAAGIDLTATGGHHAEGTTYAVHCAAGARVQIDTLTGETQVLSMDLAYDCGQSMNPQVDVGQMEGSLVQALGFSLMEEVVRSDVDKRMVNCGTWEYKVPSAFDIPIKMNIELLDMNDVEPGSLVLGSKMTGEPAQLAGLSVFFAVKDAVLAARRAIGMPGYFRMDQPASPEKIVLACEAPLVPGSK